VNALIQAGAPLDSQNLNGATALIYAASAGT
jgi:ankyrin repeat protein